MRFKNFVEQTGALDILLVLSKQGELSMTELILELRPRSSTTTYAAFKLLKQYDLLSAIKSSERSKKLSVTLSAKGRKVKEEIEAIERLLNE